MLSERLLTVPMTKSCLVKYNLTQKIDEDCQVQSFVYTGTLLEKSGKYYLTYTDDIPEADNENLTTKVFMEIGLDKLYIKETGSKTAVMEYIPLKKTITKYDLGGYALTFTIDTTCYSLKISEETIKIVLKYSLISEGQTISDNQLIIKISDRN